jgi:hypothetical protein
MTRPRDTSAEAWQLQVEALRRMSPEKRLAAGAAMSDEVRALVEAGIRARHPEYSATELRAAIARVMLDEGAPRPAQPERNDTGE